MVSQLRSRVESILLVVDNPVEAEDLAGVLDATREDVDAVLREWAGELDARVTGWRYATTASVSGAARLSFVCVPSSTNASTASALCGRV